MTQNNVIALVINEVNSFNHTINTYCLDSNGVVDIFNKYFKHYANRLHDRVDSIIRDLYTCERLGFISLDEVNLLKEASNKLVDVTLNSYRRRFEESVSADEYDIRWIMSYGHTREEAIAELFD